MLKLESQFQILANIHINKILGQNIQLSIKPNQYSIVDQTKSILLLFEKMRNTSRAYDVTAK